MARYPVAEVGLQVLGVRVVIPVISRREFVKIGAMVGGGMVLPVGMADKVYGFTLGGNPQPLPANPLLLTKFVDPLPISELLTPYAATPNAAGVDTYDVGVFQFKSQVHSAMPATTVWGYRPTGFDPATAPVQNTYLGNAFSDQAGNQDPGDVEEQPGRWSRIRCP